MLSAFVRPSDAVRRAAILAAAVALIVPLPARCLACTVGVTDCSHCQTAQKSAAQPAPRSCCERHTADNDAAASAANCASHVQSKTCGCKMQVPDRTYVTVDRQVVQSDLIAMLPSVQPLLTFDAGQINRIAAAYDNVPPPVPHRILHCSWII